MGYTHCAEISRTLTGEEFEILATDTRVIVKVAKELGIPLGRGIYGTDGDVVISGDAIELNGVGDQSAESLHITRSRQMDAHSPVYTFCKTYRRNYSPVVEAVLMSLKQAAPHAIRVGSDGRWGYEWLHGSDCIQNPADRDVEECLNTDPGHVGLGGRALYSLAFPSSPEPMYVFESTLTGTVYENQKIHMPRDLECKRWGSSFVGLPFGVTLGWLLDQAKREPRPICTLCGEATETRIACKEDRGYNWDTPMCEFCLNERILSGKLLGYSFATNPFRLVSITQPRLAF